MLNLLFRDFNKEIKTLALITFINRLGTVVVPFLSKYMKESMQLSYSEVGWVMVFFGIGSLIGTFISGKLSDIFGSYKVMIFSLFTSGIILILLQFANTFKTLCFSVFIFTLIADMYRPAMMLTVNNYVTKEMRLKSLSLIRSATNLGFVFGPILGAFLIINQGYRLLFLIDGMTCIIAVCLFILFVEEKKNLYKLKFNKTNQDKLAPLKDIPFVLNWIIAMITGYLYFQVFSILPIYHKTAYRLTEIDTGLFLAFSGILFIFMEISVVNYVQRKNIHNLSAIIIGLIIMGISYSFLFLIHKPWVFWIFMFGITLGNMLTFSFCSGFVMNRSHKNQEGIFMSAFQMSYGFAHIFSSKTGLTIIQKYNFDTNWEFNFLISIVGVIITFYVFILVNKEKENTRDKVSISF